MQLVVLLDDNTERADAQAIGERTAPNKDAHSGDGPNGLAWYHLAGEQQ